MDDEKHEPLWDETVSEVQLLVREYFEHADRVERQNELIEKLK